MLSAAAHELCRVEVLADLFEDGRIVRIANQLCKRFLCNLHPALGVGDLNLNRGEVGRQRGRRETGRCRAIAGDTRRSRSA